MSGPTYPRRLSVAIDEADLDERYRNARLREFPAYNFTPRQARARVEKLMLARTSVIAAVMAVVAWAVMAMVR